MNKNLALLKKADPSLLILLLLCIFIFFFANWYLSLSYTPHRGTPNYREDGGIIKTVANKKYLIKKGYDRPSLSLPGAPKGDGLLLGADWPSMTLPDDTRAGLDTSLIILVNDASTTTGVSFRLDVAKKIYGPMNYRGKKFGLSYYTLSKEGIVQRNTAPLIPPEKMVEELFVQPSSSAFFIKCNGDLSVPYPGCTENFAEDGLLFQVTFRKTHLKEWKAIKEAVVKLVRSFRLPDNP